MSLNTWKSDFKFWIGGSKTLNDGTYQFAITAKKIDSSNVKSLFDFYGIDNSNSNIKANNLASIILYTNTNDHDSTISTVDVLGASIYYVIDEKLKVAIFEKKENSLKIIPSLNVEIAKIPVMDFYNTALIFRKSKTDTLKSFLIATDNFTQEQMKKIMNNSKGNFSKILTAYKSNL